MRASYFVPMSVRSCRCRRHFTAARAFTLFELILVLAVILLMAAMIVPSLDSMYADSRLTAAADMVRGGWADAQAHALNEGRAYRFAVTPNTGHFRIAPDSSEFWSGGSDDPSDADSTEKPLVQEDNLPKGVRFTTTDGLQSGNNEDFGSMNSTQASADGNWTAVATFLPDGTAKNDAAIAFQAKGARPVILKLRGFTGVVTMKTVAPEGTR